MHELLEMTRHEIVCILLSGALSSFESLMANYEIGSQRIRGPFDSAPYSAAIHSCERFLEHIVEVRQSSLFFQPFLFGGKHPISRAYLAISILWAHVLGSRY